MGVEPPGLRQGGGARVAPARPGAADDQHAVGPGGEERGGEILPVRRPVFDDGRAARSGDPGAEQGRQGVGRTLRRGGEDPQGWTAHVEPGAPGRREREALQRGHPFARGDETSARGQFGIRGTRALAGRDLGLDPARIVADRVRRQQGVGAGRQRGAGLDPGRGAGHHDGGVRRGADDLRRLHRPAVAQGRAPHRQAGPDRDVPGRHGADRRGELHADGRDRACEACEQRHRLGDGHQRGRGRPRPHRRTPG